MNLLQKQLNGFFKPKPKIILPKQDNWKIHASLCIHRVIDAGALDSMLNLLCWPNPKVTFSRLAGDAMIDRARGQEATMFYKKTDSDILLFLDDDIVYKPEQIIRMCHEAYVRKGVVGGAYIIKREENSWISCKPLDDKPIVFQENGEVVKVRWLGGGCMAIHRNVLTDMIYDLKLPLCYPNEDIQFFPFFMPQVIKLENGDHIYLSEDWSLCENARKLGYDIFLDTSVQLSHAGRYNYEMSDLLRQPRPKVERIEYVDPSSKVETSKDLGEHKENTI